MRTMAGEPSLTSPAFVPNARDGASALTSQQLRERTPHLPGELIQIGGDAQRGNKILATTPTFQACRSVCTEET